MPITSTGITSVMHGRSAIALSSAWVSALADKVTQSCVGVLLVYKRAERRGKASLDLALHLQTVTFIEWAMLGSNQRPLPCEGSALPLS